MSLGRLPLTSDAIKAVRQEIDRRLARIGGANSPALKAAARALAKSVRRVLSVKGGARVASSLKSKRLRAIGGTPSAPGEPPRKQTGRLAKSVKEGPVGTGRRVGVLAFTGPLLEAGVHATKGAASARSSIGRLLRSGRRGKSRKARAASRSLAIAARPFMQRAIDLAQPEMVDVLVTLSAEEVAR